MDQCVRGRMAAAAAVIAVFCSGSKPATAEVLCAGKLGHVRLRAECPAHERLLDVRELLRSSTPVDPVPLENFTTGTEETSGLGTVAAFSGKVRAITPCRLIDTRVGKESALDGDDIGAFAADEKRTYDLDGFCGIPAGAIGVSLNVSVVPGPAGGFVSAGPTGGVPSPPDFASLTFGPNGPAISNAQVFPIDATGSLDVYSAVAGVQVVVDTNGYIEEDLPRTIVVPSTGTNLENGAALEAAITTATSQTPAPSAATPWLIQLEPGTYEVTLPLQLTDGIHLAGAGSAVTQIVGPDVGISAFDFAGGTSSARDLAVSHDFITIQSLTGTTAVLQRVSVTGTNVISVAGTLAIEESTLSGTGTDGDIFLVNGGTLTVRNSTLTSTGDSGADGIIQESGTSSVDIEYSSISPLGIVANAEIRCRATVSGATFLSTTCPTP